MKIYTCKKEKIGINNLKFVWGLWNAFHINIIDRKEKLGLQITIKKTNNKLLFHKYYVCNIIYSNKKNMLANRWMKVPYLKKIFLI